MDTLLLTLRFLPFLRGCCAFSRGHAQSVFPQPAPTPLPDHPPPAAPTCTR